MAQTQVQTRPITMTQALNEAMREEMRRNERVFILGEDIQSGVYGASGGLAAEFGKERVRDCPLSENAFFGAAVGAAAVGMRPIVESAFCFAWVAMDSLVSQAAKMRYMFGGRSEEHTSELQSRSDLVCRLLLEKKKQGHDKVV